MAQSEFWNKLKNRIKEVSIAAADFTEEQAVIGKLKFEILTLKRKSEQMTKQLGSHVYDMSKLTDKPSVFDDYEVTQFIRDITDIKAQIEIKRSEIEVVADNFRTKKKTDSSEVYQPAAEDSSPPRSKSRRSHKMTSGTTAQSSSTEMKSRTRRKYTRKSLKNKTNSKPPPKASGRDTKDE